MNKEWKLNITAFLLAAGILLLGIGGICIILWIGVSLSVYLPYVVCILFLLGLVYMVSIPIRDILEQKELSKEYQKKKDEERKRKGWLPN
jgi:hypothetical protein